MIQVYILTVTDDAEFGRVLHESVWFNTDKALAHGESLKPGFMAKNPGYYAMHDPKGNSLIVRTRALAVFDSENLVVGKESG